MKRYFLANPSEPKRPRRNSDFPFIIPFQHRSDDVVPPPQPPSEPITTDQVLERLQLTQEKADAISQIPQGSQPWLDARKNRLTASNFGAAVGLNRYKSPNGLLKDMLWNTFKGNAATRWGSEHEDVARDAYIAKIQAEIDAGTSPYTSIRVEETGLAVNPGRPWLGSSPDGVVHVTTPDGNAHKFLLEIKCPFRKEFYDPPVPVYYNCQIQGVMANMDLPHCDFVVWTPTGMQITRVDFDTEFWDTTLFPKLKAFYFDRYLQAFVDKTNGVLKHGEIKPTLVL
jgi:putative phage-type endonuclease